MKNLFININLLNHLEIILTACNVILLTKNALRFNAAIALDKNF